MIADRSVPESLKLTAYSLSPRLFFPRHRAVAGGAGGLPRYHSPDVRLVPPHGQVTQLDRRPLGPQALAHLLHPDDHDDVVGHLRRFQFRGLGIGIPTLRDVLARYRDMLIIIEMKEDSVEMGRAVAAEIRAADAVERVCAAGYGQRSLDAARAALPEMATSASRPEAQWAVYRSMAGLPVRRARYNAFQVPETAGWIRIISPRFIRHVHDAGRRLQAWTIDEEPDMRRLLGWGVDGLISNRPDVAVRVRDAFLGGVRL